MKKCMMIIALVASFATKAEGTSIVVDAWRGETVYVKVEDRCAFDARVLHDVQLDGIEISLGSAEAVSYREKPNGEQMRHRLDCLKMFESGKGVNRDKLVNLFCRIAVDAKAKPGWYDVGPLKLRVLDRVLPPANERKYFLDLWQHPWAVSRFFDLKPFSNAHYKAMEKVWRVLAECGQKALTVTLLDLPWNHQCYDGYASMIGRIKKDDGSWEFDYSLFDEYVEFGRKCGIGPDIACYTMCPWGYVVRWKNEQGETKSVKAIPGTKEFEDYWGDFLVDFAKHLKEKGWFEDAYIAMDEREPEDVKNITLFIQKKAPGMKVAMAGNRRPSDFKGITIDNYSQIVSHVSPEFLNEIKERRKEGKKTTFYVCCWPPKPNNFMMSPDEEGYWVGAYPALSGFDGFLRWAANSWPCNPYKDASCGTWSAGDTYFIYPNGELSLRFIALRAGIIAAEKARILNEDGSLDKELEELAKKYDVGAALKGTLNLKDFQRDLEKIVNR